MSFKSKFLPLVYENVRMIVNLPTRHFWRYHSSKHFREFYLQDGGENSAGMDMNRNYVTVTLCIPPCDYALYKSTFYLLTYTVLWVETIRIPRAEGCGSPGM